MSRKKTKSRGGASMSGILWQLLPACLMVTVFAGIGVMHVMSRVQVVDSGYRLSQLEQENHALVLENDRLKLELATLKNPARLEKVAREQLGMAPPSAGAVLTLNHPAQASRISVVSEPPRASLGRRVAIAERAR